jgi:hypothetical protein
MGWWRLISKTLNEEEWASVLDFRAQKEVLG